MISEAEKGDYRTEAAGSHAKLSGYLKPMRVGDENPVAYLSRWLHRDVDLVDLLGFCSKHLSGQAAILLTGLPELEVLLAELTFEELVKQRNPV